MTEIIGHAVAGIRATYPAWQIDVVGLTKVTAALKSTLGSAEVVYATPGPVSPLVMANVLKARQVEEVRPRPY